MKYIPTFLLLIFAFVASAQYNNCKMIIDGKDFESKSEITKEDLMKFCSMEQRDTRLERKLKPVYYEWCLTYLGKRMKGTSHDCSRLEEAIKNLKTEGILFIDNIKYKDVAGLCNGQFAFTIK